MKDKKEQKGYLITGEEIQEEEQEEDQLEEKGALKGEV